MEPSVEGFCNALARCRLLPADQVRALRQRWLKQAGGAGASDLEGFARWLVAEKVMTEYQAGVVRRGNAEQLLVGPYVIQERIGKGRMAGVYRAVHNLGQTVAVKILPPSKAKDPQILARFRRESRLALRLRHPNIVRTFQVGEHNGLHYLAMEYLEGETLAEVLARRRQLPPGEAVRLVHQALQALEHIHEQGLVHRDLKPGNLMLVGCTPQSTTQATVKVLDIGTGRALFDEAPGGAGPGFELTNEGDLLGTPEYMAPEQARDAHGADIRADVYSLGCVLYHALAGQPPFRDSSPVALLVKHASEEPRPVRAFNPAVPEGLEQILGWMMAKDPARRYPTPQRAAQALEVFLAAGAEVVPLERDPRMRTYLNWLSTQETVDHPASPEPPRPAPARAASPPAGGGADRPHRPPAAPAVPVLEEVEEVEEVDVEPVRAAKAPPPVPPGRPRTGRSAPPVQPARREEEDEVEVVLPAEPEEGPVNRTLMFIVLGVGGACAAAGLVLITWSVVRAIWG